jgi:hypothetical protein
MSHWVARYNLIGREQIGFREAHGCPWHVFTLVETIKNWWRQSAPGDRRATYVLFVDLKKAYDKVSPAALWKVLHYMGVPEQLLAVLRYKSDHRKTRLRFNGKLSEPIDMKEGVGQGDPLSPLLFNLFIESFGEALRRHPGLRGVILRPSIQPLNHQELHCAALLTGTPPTAKWRSAACESAGSPLR